MIGQTISHNRVSQKLGGGGVGMDRKFASDRIAWRGDFFHLKDGNLARIER